jgi:hypothetical protein
MSEEGVTITEVPADFQETPVQHQFQPEAPVEPPAAPTLADLIANGDLLNIPIANENVSLNVIVAFLNQASRRGAFSIEENAKIWECIKFFVQPSAQQ